MRIVTCCLLSRETTVRLVTCCLSYVATTRAKKRLILYEGVGFSVEGVGYSGEGVGFSVEGGGFSVGGVGFSVEDVAFSVEGVGTTRARKRVIPTPSTPAPIPRSRGAPRSSPSSAASRFTPLLCSA